MKLEPNWKLWLDLYLGNASSFKGLHSNHQQAHYFAEQLREDIISCQHANALVHSFARTCSKFVCLSRIMVLKCVYRLVVKVMTCSFKFKEHRSLVSLIEYRKFLAKSLTMLSS